MAFVKWGFFFGQRVQSDIPTFSQALLVRLRWGCVWVYTRRLCRGCVEGGVGGWRRTVWALGGVPYICMWLRCRVELLQVSETDEVTKSLVQVSPKVRKCFGCEVWM